MGAALYGDNIAFKLDLSPHVEKTHRVNRIVWSRPLIESATKEKEKTIVKMTR